ncbi:MAG TPA: DUF4126 family protein [Solirubrobacteraceae bacterium]|nr:DUF4126 family protein [Solirubrobacteraceae bacterium]
MRLFLDICQGLGLGAASGVRPFLPALLTGGLASGDLGVDFDGTKYHFLESPVWLLVITILLVVTLLLRGVLESPAFEASLAGIAIGIGALLFAGSLADHGYAAWPGLVAGGAVAMLAQASSRDLTARVSKRLDREARGALPIYFEGAAVVIAGAAVLAPPVSLLAVALLVWLLVGGRRREGERYAGLRILR